MSNSIPVQVSVSLETINNEVLMESEAQEHEYEVGSAERIVIGAGGTDDYEKLKNKPQLNGVELLGNKSFTDIGLESISNQELESLLKF